MLGYQRNRHVGSRRTGTDRAAARRVPRRVTAQNDGAKPIAEIDDETLVFAVRRSSPVAAASWSATTS